MTGRRQMVARLDRLFSRYIRARDGNKCVTCGKALPLMECGHVFSRGGGHAARWDERNAGCQCHGCNEYHERFPGPLEAWMVKTYGHAAYCEVRRAWNKPAQFTMEQLKEVESELRRRLAAQW